MASVPPYAPLQVGLFTSLSGLYVPVGNEAVRTSGYSMAGKGGALYVLDEVQSTAEGSTAWRFQSANGRWFRLADDIEPTPAQFGGIGNLTADDTVALQAWLSYGGGAVTVSAMTASSSTVTCTVASTARMFTNQSVTIVGSEQWEYNGEHTLTVASGTTFTFVATSPPTVTTATGTFTAYTRSVGLRLANGKYVATSDMTVPVGRNACNLRGDGADGSEIRLSGPSIVNGIFFNAYPVMNMTLTGITGSFTLGETVTQPNGATGKVTFFSGSALRIANVPFANTFKRGVVITGGTSGATATLNTADSSGYLQSPKWTDVRVSGDGTNASRGFTMYGLTVPRLTNCKVRDIAGTALAVTYALMSKIDHCQFYSNGSSSSSPVEFDYCTTVRLDHVYVSGGRTGTKSALKIDRTGNIVITSGGLESSGVAIQLGSKTESIVAVNSITVLGTDVENPAAPAIAQVVSSITIASPGVVTTSAAHGLLNGYPIVFTTTGALPTGITAGTIYYAKSVTSTTFQFAATLNGASVNTTGTQSGTHTVTFDPTCYVEAGMGWTGTAGQGIKDLALINVSGSPSGSSSVPFAARVSNIQGFTLQGTVLGLTGSPVASLSFHGTNTGQVVFPCRSAFGNAYPWVALDGAMQNDATPLDQYINGSTKEVRTSVSQTNVGAALSCSVLATQGGIYSTVKVTNGSAQTVTSMSGGNGATKTGSRVTIIPQDANTTLAHNTGFNQFTLRTGANTALASGLPYTFEYNGTAWLQVS